MRRTVLPAVLLALSTALTGCVDLPVVGNLGEQIKPYLPELIRDRLFPTDAQQAAPTPTSSAARKRRRRRQAAPGADGATTAAAEGHDVETAARRPTVSLVYEQYLTRNMEFDRLRTQGIEQLYGGQTDRAITSFKDALAKKPGDRSVEDLLQLAQNPPVNRPLDGGTHIPPGVEPGMIPGLSNTFPTN